MRKKNKHGEEMKRRRRGDNEMEVLGKERERMNTRNGG